jgi:hypothetical protein
MVRGLVLLLCLFTSAPPAAAPQRALPQPDTGFAFDSLHGIAAWLRYYGREGYIGADVADAMGIARPEGEALLAAWQRGFRTGDVLHIAQISADSERDFILFTVQRPDDRVYLYLSTPLGGLQKAFLSIPSRNLVVPLGRGEAELRWRAEVIYWKERSESR